MDTCAPKLPLVVPLRLALPLRLAVPPRLALLRDAARPRGALERSDGRIVADRMSLR
jgi:hypothetical protein